MPHTTPCLTAPEIKMLLSNSNQPDTPDHRCDWCNERPGDEIFAATSFYDAVVLCPDCRKGLGEEARTRNI